MQEFFTGISFYDIAWYILIYSFLGWILEVIFCSANTGQFVNRGFLNGPVCPIYGFGGTAVILLLRPLAGTFLPLFLGSVVITSLLELVTGWILNKLFHTRWWDYTRQPFNIGGYVCLKFSLAWGVAGVLLMRVLHPAVEGLVRLVPPVLGVLLLAVLYAVFAADAIVTVNAILKLNRHLGELARIAEGLHRGSETLAESIGGRAVTTVDKIEELEIPALVEATRDAGREKLEEQKQKLEAGVEEQKQRMAALLGKSNRIHGRLLRAFPDMRHTRYGEALEQLKARYSTHIRRGEDGGPGDEKK